MHRSYKTAIITGASSGIGREFAKQLATSGVHVGVIARREESLKQLQKELSHADGQIYWRCADVSDRAALNQAIKELIGELNGVDLLIANAGVATGTSTQNFNVDSIEQVYRVNVLGVIYAIEAVLPQMKTQGFGHVVGLSSSGAFRGFPFKGAYCGSKAAIRVHFDSLRAELAAFGIRSTTFVPGFIRSEITDQLKFRMPFFMETDAAVRQMLKAIYKGKIFAVIPWQMQFYLIPLRMIPPSVFYFFSKRIFANALKRQTGRAKGQVLDQQP